ncbi:MAG: FecR domain-containing protein, partial [Anaerolineales bacterium]|nr:FecR domain-containing protein [Anaerolineales bacterium]
AVGGQISATARNNQVSILRAANGNQPEPLPAPSNGQLAVGDGIDVDDAGYAQLVFPDLFVVEVMRDGELVVQQAILDENNAIVSLSQVGGAILNDFNADEALDRRFVIETDFARITATGTQFLIAREANTPLEWIVALSAAPNDLYVYADGVTKTVTTNQARWVSPIGEPSPAFGADMGNMSQWVQNLRDGAPVAEFGEMIWAYANEKADSTTLPETLQVGVPFLLGNTAVTLQPGGTYRRLQCNGDGITDIYVENGTLSFDLRGVMGRVRAFDVTVQNYAEPGQNSLYGYNPAGIDSANRIAETANRTDTKSWEVLSLRSPEQPFHYAELNLTRGCFLGFSIVEPDAPPDAAVADIPLEPTSTVTPDPGDISPPPAPVGLTPNGVPYSCRPGETVSITFAWQAVSDPSGVFQYQTEAQFLGYDTDQYQAVDLNNWAAATQTTQSFGCVPGRLEWRVRAVDNSQNVGAWSAWAGVELVERINQDPVFISQPVTAPNRASYYEYQIAALDPDGDKVVISASEKPDWLTLTDNGDATAVLAGDVPRGLGYETTSWTAPQVASAGSVSLNQTQPPTPTPGGVLVPVKLVVEDAFGGVGTQSFEIVVPISAPDEQTTTPTAVPPQVVYESMPKTVDVGANYDGQIIIDQGSIEVVSLPPWLRYGYGEGQNKSVVFLTGAPAADDVGTAVVTFRLTGSEGANAGTAEVRYQFEVMAEPTPTPPELIVENVPLEFVTGPNKSYSGELTLDYGVVEVAFTPSWMGYSYSEAGPNSVLFYGIPTSEDVGTQTLTVQFVAPNGNSISRSYNIAVIDGSS